MYCKYQIYFSIAQIYWMLMLRSTIFPCFPTNENVIYVRFVAFCWSNEGIPAQVKVTAWIAREANHLLNNQQNKSSIKDQYGIISTFSLYTYINFTEWQCSKKTKQNFCAWMLKGRTGIYRTIDGSRGLVIHLLSYTFSFY